MLIKKFMKKGMGAQNAPYYKAASSLPTLNFIGSTNTVSGTGTTVTAAGVNIGTASADRLVVVVAYSIQSGAGPFVSATLDSGGGAVAMTLVNQDDTTGTSNAAILQLTVASGTSATLALTYSTATNGQVFFDVYTITGLSSTTATSNHTGGFASSLNTSLATSSGGVVIVGSHQYSNASVVDTITGAPLTYTADRNSYAYTGYSCTTTASAISATSSGSYSVTATWGAAAHSALVVAAWR